MRLKLAVSLFVLGIMTAGVLLNVESWPALIFWSILPLDAE